MTEIDTKVALLQGLIQGDSYGLELIDRIRVATNGRIKMMQGRVYPALHELESEGLLESYESEPLPERSGRPRRYYRITAEGRRVARAQARAVYALLKPALGMA